MANKNFFDQYRREAMVGGDWREGPTGILFPPEEGAVNGLWLALLHRQPADIDQPREFRVLAADTSGIPLVVDHAPHIYDPTRYQGHTKVAIDGLPIEELIATNFNLHPKVREMIETQRVRLEKLQPNVPNEKILAVHGFAAGFLPVSIAWPPLRLGTEDNFVQLQKTDYGSPGWSD